jgi:dTDP-4-dehydrorhamnose reductase
MKKIYMAGAGGMLGAAFYEIFSQNYLIECSDKDVNESWLDLLDFRDFEKYHTKVSRFKPDYLFHLGAFTDLEYCELHVDDTYLTNSLSVENAVHIANKLDIPLLYISTAGIYDGKKDVYDDWDLPNPLGHYARSKYAGELYASKYAKRSLICRAGWMMGGGIQKDKKFVKKIFQQILDGKKDLYVVNDRLGTPTYTIDFARNVKLLLEKEYWGVYNMVSGGLTSRFEVCSEIIKILSLENKVNIHEVDSSFFSQEYFADRPASERLVNKKLDLRGLNIMRNWKVALTEYIEKSYSNIL